MKSVAERHGFRASFMPKPFKDLTGNGCHVHVSAWTPGTDENLFHDDADTDGLSAMGRGFLAGVIDHAQALGAVLNPVVNSYKRIQPGTTTSGATWAPNAVTWSGNNRTHMVRVPGAGRFELRLADGAANPYLLQAAILAAGLDGLDNRTALPPRSDVNMYTVAPGSIDAPRLPTNLRDALDLFRADAALRTGLGPEVSASYLKLKTAEWESYLAHFSRWETLNAIDI